MTAHDHRVITPGCYRCELNEDEMLSAKAEQSATVTISAELACNILWPLTEKERRNALAGLADAYRAAVSAEENKIRENR